MKHMRCTIPATLLMIVLLTSICLSALADNEAEMGVFHLVYQEESGLGDSFVAYPYFYASVCPEEMSPDTFNEMMDAKAHIDEYLQLLSTLREGSTGLKMNYETSQNEVWNESESMWALPRYISLLFNARGKMLSGPPSQVYYPMTFDLATGKEVSFDQLFSDPTGAKAWIEDYLTEEVAPNLSTHLENSELLPVPYDRFFLDGYGNLILVYEHSQLSFLSGYSGAIAFRYSELWDYLDTSPDSVAMQALYRPEQYPLDAAPAYETGDWVYDLTDSLSTHLRIGELLELALNYFRSTTDSGFYPSGAYYEVEEAALRGTLILTDESEEKITGILTSRVDHFGINTGKTTMDEAISLIRSDPLARLPISEAAAELYRVCPGEAAVYSSAQKDGSHLSLTLYADEAGIIRYIKLAQE